MSTPGDDGSMHELEIEVREELVLTESNGPEQEADLPVSAWLYDPVDAERERTILRDLLGAVEGLENDQRHGNAGD
ncbi:hypothetical protein GCM10023191_021000 [Actinoallomurus oryzae]|jgi:hypothetical protein|uniref:Uncharacterized protein n=1 Tax=Actinoallomurus oryzae TaxID=502180 RepID=A0ABP8PQJ1_9ACTN